LSTPALVRRHEAGFHELGHLADKVVAVCQWLYDALERNGIPRRKLVCCPQGIDLPVDFERPIRSASRDGILRVGFLGRWDPVKGVHILVDAFRRLPASCRAELVIHGLPLDQAYERSVRKMAEGVPRITIAEPVERRRLFAALANIDVLAVPSLWLETGPLVVLEAFAAGVPVLGSNLGGIAELVRTERSGTLLPPGDVDAWSREIASRAAQAPTWGFPGVPAMPRSASRLASEMSDLYRELLSREFAA
jgi:glycosyltransferase involved in cell wall biosynthesis